MTGGLSFSLGDGCFATGGRCFATGNGCFAMGGGYSATGDSCFATGGGCFATRVVCFTMGGGRFRAPCRRNAIGHSTLRAMRGRRTTWLTPREGRGRLRGPDRALLSRKIMTGTLSHDARQGREQVLPRRAATPERGRFAQRGGHRMVASAVTLSAPQVDPLVGFVSDR